MARQFASVATMLVLLWNCRGEAQTEEIRFIDTIAKMKQSIAPIVCRARDVATGVSGVSVVAGTAFFLTPSGSFLTAAHVIRNLPAGCPAALYLPTAGWNPQSAELPARLYNFVVQDCAVSDEYDVARCATTFDLSTAKAALGVSVSAVVMDEKQVYPDGTQIAFSGFPLGTAQPLTSRGSIAAYRHTGQIPNGQIVLDKNAWPGASGSPVYVNNGRVVGMVVSRGIGDGSGTAYALPAALIQRFLRQR